MSDLLVIAASNGENLKLATRFATEAEGRGLSVDILDLTAIDLPLFTPRTRAAGTPAALPALEQRLRASPRWLICSPEYNGSIPPVFTSALAWLTVQGTDFRALFNNRPIVIASHSGGGGHTMLVALRLQLAHLGAQVVGRKLTSSPDTPASDATIADLIKRLLSLPAPHP